MKEIKHEPIDLEACFDNVYEIPLDEDKNENPVPFYVTEADGTEYFYCDNIRIKVSERFNDNGKPIDNLIEDVIRYEAGSTKKILPKAC